jgi:hypothetical protein
MWIELGGIVCGETLRPMPKASPWLHGINGLDLKGKGDWGLSTSEIRIWLFFLNSIIKGILPGLT